MLTTVTEDPGAPLLPSWSAAMDATGVRDLEQALLLRDELMGIVGHDLRNPLSAIVSLVALSKDGDSLPPRARDRLARVEAAAARMREIIDTLLDLTRSRFAGALPVSIVPTDLAPVCEAVVQELEAAYPSHPIALAIAGDCNGIWDPCRLGQVISNLVGNALTHGDPRGPVRISMEGGTESVIIEIQNRGPVIPAEHLPALFEPFRRGASRQKSAGHRGLGLGLHIAKQIVVTHRGSISARSSADEGTVFRVELPR